MFNQNKFSEECSTAIAQATVKKIDSILQPAFQNQYGVDSSDIAMLREVFLQESKALEAINAAMRVVTNYTE